MPGKKKFIDKKNAVTFYLGHRSQRDPLIADETAPQRVLVPMDQVPSAYTTNPSTSSSNKSASKVDAAKRKEEQLEYGIYFDDDYDYLQHLKDSKEVSNVEWDLCERIRAPVKQSQAQADSSDTKDIKLKLPSSVFQSDYEEKVGMLNKAAPAHGPRPDLDSDILAALDDDFDFDDPDNCLEDNFIDLANGGVNDAESAAQLKPEDMEGLFSSEDEDDNEEEDDDSVVGSLEGPQYTFNGEETKSHFTNYSMSSSVVRRNDQLTLIDDRFEKMFQDYEDTEIGALDCDEIEGHLNDESDMLMKCAEEFEADNDDGVTLNEKICKLALKQGELSDSNDDSLTDSDKETKEKEKWDCASIISTYSTVKNRPKLIKEVSQRNRIRVSSKTGMPVGVLGKGLTKSNLKDLETAYDEEHRLPTKSLMSAMSSKRAKDETSEERLQRKKILKEIRRERRIERKANTDAFKDEKKRQEKVRLNMKANLQGLKL